MTKERYSYHTQSSLMDFIFYSNGPRGNIAKAVVYTPREIAGLKYYNLGFGDLNLKTGDIDDLSVSDNKDRDKILATIAATVLEFTTRFPEVAVYAEGSTYSRTRLYQMAIASNLKDIDEYMNVYGLIGDRWYGFEKNVNYDAFMILRKN